MRHVHKYQKVNLSRRKDKPYYVYRCMKPDCPHYIRVDLALGRMTECHGCGEVMLITKQTLKQSGGKPPTKPKCPECLLKSRVGASTIAEFLEEKETSSDEN